jgi:CubicO group peptidase (beta-lactamase class C family)
LPDFIELMLAQPDKFWQPEETITYTKVALSPFFPPGQGFHYSDTNYQLLGLIIQNVTGKALHEVYRERLFNPLGMNNTYVEFYETPRPALPGRDLSHVYLGLLDYTDLRAISADWACGGLASTTEDLNRFIRAFADDGIDGIGWIIGHDGFPGSFMYYLRRRACMGGQFRSRQATTCFSATARRSLSGSRASRARREANC